MDDKQIEYSDVDETQVHLITDLRAQFLPFNRALGKDFPEEYTDEAMAKNLERFLAKAERGAVRIFLARDKSSGRYVGFCLTTLDERGEGVIESFLVDKGYRGGGIGRDLFQRALDWLEGKSARSIKLEVLAGNEGAMRFYKRFGFRPLSMTMKRLKRS